MTYVRARLALDGLPSGARLMVLLKGDDPRINVASNARRQGHLVLSCEDGPEGVTRLLLQKK
jgi:TusA-related sulfurtransferase